jgi:hypothetical protein
MRVRIAVAGDGFIGRTKRGTRRDNGDLKRGGLKWWLSKLVLPN